MKHNKFQKALLILTLSMATFILPSPTPIEAKTQSVSPAVTKIRQASKPVTKNSGKPAPQIKILVNNTAQTLADPIIMDNGRVFLPVRALGNLLDIDVNYLDTYKVATASNSTAYLELPLGYNKAAKDKTLTLPIDTNKKDTRIITHNSRTYLPVRFISENLGYNISYAYQTVSITTDGSTPVVPTKPEKPVETSEFKVPSGVPSSAVLVDSEPKEKFHKFNYTKQISDGAKIKTITVSNNKDDGEPRSILFGVDKDGNMISADYTKSRGLSFSFEYPNINQDAVNDIRDLAITFFSYYGY